MSRPPVDVSLNFMPAFFHKHLGVTYGDAFYFDPFFRAQIELAESRFLGEVLGRFSADLPPASPSPGLFIQPIDVIKATQGATVYCPPDATLETHGHAWKGCTPAEIARVDPRDAAHHAFIDTLLDQYRELQRLYGDRADLFGIKAGTMCIHTPYTTAHQLCGEDLFLLLMDDPQGARVIFDKVWALYQAVFARLSSELGAPRPSRVILGDCSASLIAAEQYRDVVSPANQAIASLFQQVIYHSCGASTHLLEAFTDIPGVTAVELGPGTDLASAVRCFPGVAMRPLIDPLTVRNEDADRVAGMTGDLLRACSPAPATTLCAWSLDRDTPLANVEAVYEAVERHNTRG